MIRAVVFDLDGVLRRWSPVRTHSIERRFGIPPGSIDGVAFGRRLLERAVTGSITDEAWREEVARGLWALYGMPGRDAVDEWARLAGEVDQAVLALVRDVRLGMPVALLTNATTRLADDLTALGLAGEFDFVVNSADLHRSKPDPDVFRWTARLLEVPCADCAFVDDELRHVVAAGAVGMAAIQHRNAAMTRRRLAKIGALAVRPPMLHG